MSRTSASVRMPDLMTVLPSESLHARQSKTVRATHVSLSSQHARVAVLEGLLDTFGEREAVKLRAVERACARKAARSKSSVHSDRIVSN